MAQVEVKVPDIGDFESVEIIEVMVKAGDSIKAEQSLITVESDKASMEIPSSHAGIVKELKVKLGDKVAEGSLVLLLETADAAASAPASVAAAAAAPVATPAPAPAAAPVAAAAAGGSITVEVPDIGDFDSVAVIELLVKPGDVVKAEQSLITVESDKASMEIPSSHAGIVESLLVKLGDQVSKGSPVVVLKAAAGAAAAPAAVSAPAPAAAAVTVAAAEPAERAVPAAAPPASGGALPHASPSIRKFARELGVPLAEVRGSGPKGRITAAGRAGLRQGRDLRRTAHAGAGGQGAGAGGCRRWRRARPAALAEGGLRQVRTGRTQGAVAHQEDQRRQPAPQLGRDPACHEPRRCRHHRARGLPRPAQQGEREERHQGHDAGLPDQGLRRGAEEVPRVQRLARRRRGWC